MRLPAVPTKAVVEHLNSTYFKNVWNATDDRGRSNSRLFKVNERIQTGAVPVGQSVVGLPTTGVVYAVYRTSYRGLSRYSSLPDNIWVTDKYLFDNFNVTLRVYSSDGRMFPFDQIHLRYILQDDTVLVAIDTQIAKKCSGESYPELYLTYDRDPTRATPIVSQSFVVSTLVGSTTTPSMVSAAIAQANIAYPNKTFVSVNGFVYSPIHVPTLVNRDVVNITSDPDIVSTFEITVDDNVTGYYSEKYGEYRELIHIPKSVNPDNTIITTDSLIFTVVDVATNKGVLGHRLNNHSIESVTHNDFSVARTTIQSLSNSLGASNVKIRVYVRLATNPNYLRSDVNRMKDLYSLSDDTIVDQLMGRAIPGIEEWNAANLEQSPFINLLYKFTGFVSDTIVEEFSDSVGYYDLVSTLGQQMRFYTYKGSQVQIVKPARLFGYECTAVVYADGRKVPEGEYELSNYSDRTFTLGFTANSSVTVGSRIGIYICEYDLREIIPFNPTSLAPSIILENDDYDLFEITTFNELSQVYNKTTDKGYKRIPLSSAEYEITSNPDGTFTYTSKTQNLNKSIYCVPKYGMQNAIYDISNLVNNTEVIVVDIEITNNINQFIPLIGYKTIEVYLNGYRLIDGLDYEIKPYLGPGNEILQNVIVLSNSDYLNLDGSANILELTSHGDKVISEDKGYSFDNHLHRTALPMLYSPSSSRTFVKGLLQETVYENGNVLTTDSNVPNGAPYLHQHMLSYGADKLTKNISTVEELNLRGRIEHVLGIEPPQFPEVLVVNELHALYSPFLAKIVSDVGNGVFTVVDEPRNDMFLKQFSPYKHLLDRDPTIGPNPLIDRRFITLAAHYANYGVSDPEQMIRVQRLVNLVLNPSELSIKEVLL